MRAVVVEGEGCPGKGGGDTRSRQDGGAPRHGGETLRHFGGIDGWEPGAWTDS